PIKVAAQQVQVRQHNRQGRSQLVRGVGQQLALPLQRVLYRRDQLIDRRGELPDLVVALRERHTLLVVAGGGDARRRVCEARDWPERPARQQRRAANRQRQRQRAADQQERP